MRPMNVNDLNTQLECDEFLNSQSLVIGRGYPIKSLTTIATKYGERVKVALKQGTIILPERYLPLVKQELPHFETDKYSLSYEGIVNKFNYNYKVFTFGLVPIKKKKRSTFLDSDSDEDDVPINKKKRPTFLDSDSDEEDVPINKKKRPTFLDSDSDEEDVSIKKKRRAIPLDSDSDEEDEKSPAIVGEPYIGGDCLARKALQQRGIPEASIPVLLASVSAATFKRYNAEWKKWWLFCQVNTLDVLDGRFDNILRFLTEEHEKQASYGNLKSTRSALAFLLEPQLKQDPSIKRFFKGLQNLDSPNKSKCETTWDPSMIWSRLKTQCPNESLSLHLLTGKLATLMVLATGYRVQTLASIRIDDVEIKDDAVEIKIAKKTSKNGAFQPRLVLPFLEDGKKYCVATTLIAYMNRTRALRNGATSNLFITSRKPHKNAASTCISRWIKEVLKASGCNEGIGLDTIRSTAGWTEKSLSFAKFYNRPV